MCLVAVLQRASLDFPSEVVVLYIVFVLIDIVIWSLPSAVVDACGTRTPAAREVEYNGCFYRVPFSLVISSIFSIRIVISIIQHVSPITDPRSNDRSSS